ncbi:cupin domain-containing protein [Paenibacillus sp. DCT19]|uniref:cupin domain-containing protein n=1 Tax=Paenibacillus sp. DCT19 TaxID=2211212 RepID=UPI000FE1CBFE|nr:cupin domain-containing protein [Paenibacillus sp. DCT19]
MEQTDPQVQTLFLHDDGVIPNNPTLPVLIYHGVWADSPSSAEQKMNDHHWGNSWVNGVFDYHHYHSNAHEALAVISGSVQIILGGEHGQVVTLQTGDVVVLPAGTGHKRLHASLDFRIAGAYPAGMNYNTRTGDPSERPQAVREIQQVPVPDSDPVYGSDGPLLKLWGKRTDAKQD